MTHTLGMDSNGVVYLGDRHVDEYASVDERANGGEDPISPGTSLSSCYRLGEVCDPHSFAAIGADEGERANCSSRGCWTPGDDFNGWDLEEQSKE